jgi:urease accessory protein
MPAAIRIMRSTTTTPMTTEPSALLRLLAWLSPAFPTGGFAWSQGIEWAVEAGDVRDADSLHDWLADVLVLGSGRTDAILLHQSHRAAADADALGAVCEVALAAQPAAERRDESVGQGNAFARAAGAWGAGPLPALARRMGDIPYPVAVGAMAGTHGIGEDDAALGFVQAFATNLISAAVRLVPLGQSAGLAVLAALAPTLLAVAAETREATLDDLGGACFRADLATMRHETQYTRLFRS